MAKVHQVGPVDYDITLTSYEFEEIARAVSLLGGVAPCECCVPVVEGVLRTMQDVVNQLEALGAPVIAPGGDA